MQGRKYRDMSMIYCRYIVYRRVSIRYFMEKYFDEISREIPKNRQYLAIYRWFTKVADFSQYITWSMRVNDGQTHYSEVNALQSWKKALPFAVEGIRTPNQKVWGLTHLPSRHTCLCYVICTKHIYS